MYRIYIGERPLNYVAVNTLTLTAFYVTPKKNLQKPTYAFG